MRRLKKSKLLTKALGNGDAKKGRIANIYRYSIKKAKTKPVKIAGALIGIGAAVSGLMIWLRSRR